MLSDFEFNERLIHIQSFVAQNGEEIDFNRKCYDFIPPFTQRTSAYKVWQEKISRIQLIINEKNAARRALEPLLSLMIVMRKGLSKISKSQWKAIGLPSDRAEAIAGTRIRRRIPI
jgi:hypothetical protein